MFTTMSTPSTALEAQLRQFYADFERGASEACLAQLHPKVSFRDPFFGERKGAGVVAMIRMLCAGRTPDRRFEVHSVSVHDATHATVQWTAHYTFTLTGRRIANCISTPVELREGRLYRYEDRFDTWAWHRMAFGPLGWILGWTPLLTGRVSATLDRRLASFAHPSTAS